MPKDSQPDNKRARMKKCRGQTPITREIIRLAGSSENPVVNVLSKPGMWVQMMTTKEPDDSMIEVAIRAVEEVFDWKAYLEENFSKTEESFGENKCTQEECAL